ncbi:hypothetical protein B0O99DRAFT_644483 [Bisporella sp. PMI_857]|nr:hypothetical protein B0O99DRAFT_644483 [Bisporella sp. PMI_857]
MPSAHTTSKKSSKGPQKKSRVNHAKATETPAGGEDSSLMPAASLEIGSSATATTYPIHYQTLSEHGSDAINVESQVGVLPDGYTTDHSLQAISYTPYQPLRDIVYTQDVTRHSAAAFGGTSSLIGLQEVVQTTSIITAQQQQSVNTPQHTPQAYELPHTLMLYQELNPPQCQQHQEVVDHQLNRWAYETSNLETTFADRLEKSNWKNSCLSRL